MHPGVPYLLGNTFFPECSIPNIIDNSPMKTCLYMVGRSDNRNVYAEVPTESNGGCSISWDDAVPLQSEFDFIQHRRLTKTNVGLILL